MRKNDRPLNSIRSIKIIPDQLKFADGSVLIEMGDTKVLIAATVEEKVPPFLKGSGSGWITAEYSMLPRSTDKRTIRERTPIRISGRTQEIQRLIGRSLRAITDLEALNERTIIIDCDVIQADGGTRSAAITGGCVALALALESLLSSNKLGQMPLINLAGAVSVGLVKGEPMLDLDYSEDSSAEIDMNVVQTDTGDIVEVQASAEKSTFSQAQFNTMMELAGLGIKQLIRVQKEILKERNPLFMAYETSRESSS